MVAALGRGDGAEDVEGGGVGAVEARDRQTMDLGSGAIPMKRVRPASS